MGCAISSAQGALGSPMVASVLRANCILRGVKKDSGFELVFCAAGLERGGIVIFGDAAPAMSTIAVP